MEELFWRKKGGGRKKTKEKIQMKPKLQSYREKEKGRKEGKKQKFEDEVFLNARDLVSKKRELKLSLQKKRCRRCCWWPHATKGQEEGTQKQKEDKMMKKGRQRARTFSFLFPIFSCHGVRTPDSVAAISFFLFF